MRIPKRLTAAFTGAAIATLTLSAVASASHPNGYSLFGDAEYVSPGNASNRAVQIRSDLTPGFGGIDFDIPEGTTFADLTELWTDFMPQDILDLCVGGSPRFQLNMGVDTNADGFEDNIHVYFGIDSASPPCLPSGWQNTTNLLETGKLLDTSQLPGGTFYDPYDLALAKYGAYSVTGIQVVVDSFWAHVNDSEQAFIIDNTVIGIDGEEHLYTYEVPQPESKDDCKKGGWRELAREDGTPFRNQGDCIQYANTGQ